MRSGLPVFLRKCSSYSKTNKNAQISKFLDFLNYYKASLIQTSFIKFGINQYGSRPASHEEHGGTKVTK